MAFLAFLQQQNRKQSNVSQNSQSLVSNFYNIHFSTHDFRQMALKKDVSSKESRFYFRHARRFIDGFFSTMHFVHPILKKDKFLDRCEKLWFSSHAPTKNFLGLYYGVCSLGALIMEWETKELDGLDRFEWSRRLFEHALSTYGRVDVVVCNKSCVACLKLLTHILSFARSQAQA